MSKAQQAAQLWTTLSVVEQDAYFDRAYWSLIAEHEERLKQNPGARMPNEAKVTATAQLIALESLGDGEARALAHRAVRDDIENEPRVWRTHWVDLAALKLGFDSDDVDEIEADCKRRGITLKTLDDWRIQFDLAQLEEHVRRGAPRCE